MVEAEEAGRLRLKEAWAVVAVVVERYWKVALEGVVVVDHQTRQAELASQ